ncbi:MAG TPA: cytochrome c-type biogenesis CcmF C-terminal domain-containing protein, partial [Flavisolibacter sp.]|nr:cytochrome c-type biogenesis CcmF C-terminal domain-containing protein [Flavisolibacter sp.]
KWHLRFFVFIFMLPSLVLLIQRYKKIPFIQKEEETSSREFWMFIGSLVLFLSALLISGMTSIPVFNKIAALFTKGDKLFKPIAVGEEAAYAYNRIQIFVAILLGLFTGFGMYLKYKTTGKPFLKKMIWPAVAGLVVGILILVLGNINYKDKGAGYMAAVWVAVIAAVYSVIANAAYIWSGSKGSMSRSGGAIAHVGFAILLTGILISSSKKEILCFNTSGIFVPFGSDSKEKAGENLTLVKGLKTTMGNYWVTYDGDSVHPRKALWYYHLKFESKDGKESFSLSPNAFVNYKGNSALMANPDSKHYLTQDIFTYITSLPDPDKTKDTASFIPRNVKVGDTVFYSKGFAVLEDLKSVKNIPDPNFGPNDSATVATIKVMAKTSSIYTTKPILITKGGELYAQPDTILPENLIFQLQKVNGNHAELGVKETDSLLQYVTLKAYKFPFIILVWMGTIIMVVGFLVSMRRRIITNRLKAV